MKVQSIYNNSLLKTDLYQNQISFRGVNPPKHNLANDFDRFDYNNENDNNNDENSNPKPLPEWARKAMLFTVVFFTIKNEPVVQNLFNSDKLTKEELDRTEFFENVDKIRKDKGKSASFYQVNRLYDIERPKIKDLGNNKFSLEFNLDKQNVNLEINFDKNNKDTIEGKVQLGNASKPIKYKAVFSEDNIDEFKLLLNDNGKSIVLGRDFDGSLYKLENHKKEILNSKNVEMYEQYLDDLETLNDFKFFTNENPLWRNLNYLLLILLLYNEYKHDKNRRNNKNNSSEV